MSDKYYISCKVVFLNGMCEGATNPSSATHMKKSEAISIVASHPKYTYHKSRHTAKGNDYVICTKMKFLGNDMNIVDTMGKAKTFNSVEDAFRYMDLHSDEFDEDLCYVIDDKFTRKKRPNTVKEVAKDITPIDIFNCRDDVNSSERVYIPIKVREEVYKKSGGICPICGKTLSKYTYTIDHVVPLSRGGTSEISNLRATHEDCNKLKGNFMDAELKANIEEIVCNSVYSAPNSDIVAKLLRCFVRGTLKQRQNYIDTNNTYMLPGY